MEKYLSIKECKYGWFFKEIPLKDKLFLNPLTKNYSSKLWEKYISNKNRHYMLLKDDEFILKDTHEYNYWLDDFNNNTNRSKKILSQKINFPDNENILIFWMKEWALETKWFIFLNYWTEFLYEDEGVIIINEKKPETIIFNPHSFKIGKRKLKN